MNYFERTLLTFLINSKLKMAVIGFDMKGFSEVIHQELKERLETVESIVYTDDDLMSDADKIGAMKELFENNFYCEE